MGGRGRVYPEHSLKVLTYLALWKNVGGQTTITKSIVHFRSQILECSRIGEYWNISGELVMLEYVIFTCSKSASVI